MMEFSGILYFCIEKRKDNGEDSLTFNFDNSGNGYMAVFDGSGGAGSEIHKGLSNRKSAYIASRVCSYIFDDISRNINVNVNPDYVRDCIYNGLISVNEKFPMNDSKSSIIDVLPTTISAAIIKNNLSGIDIDFLWAGDSRGYIIDERGLAQVTYDDVDSKDSYYNIFDDSIMNNRIHGNFNKPKFELHQSKISIKSKAIVFCASDGCYDYLNSPMVFEFFLISMLIMSNSFEEAKEKMCELLKEKSGDDHTIAMAFYGFNDYSEVVSFLKDRFEFLNSEKDYFGEDYWNNKYKKNYYRYNSFDY